jgi:hypothetical protein
MTAAPDVDPMATRVADVEKALDRLSKRIPIIVTKIREALAGGVPQDAAAVRTRMLGQDLPRERPEHVADVAALLLEVAEGRQGWSA